MANQTRLDDRVKLAELDTSGVLASIEQLPDQIEQTWAERSTIQVPDSYHQIQNIVVNGMGGSTLGAHVIKTLYKDSLRYPLEVVNHYTLPAYVGPETLAVLSSYSGTTEETLSAAQQAATAGAKIAVITSGGELLDLAHTKNYPVFHIQPKHNPSNQPRMAIGYSVFGQLSLFNALGVLKLEDSEVQDVLALLRKNAPSLAPEETDQNTAKYLAYSCVDTMPFLVAAEHLEGAAHVFNNQLNENAKNMSMFASIPELNHHLMEGLSFPVVLKDGVRFLFIQSGLYHPRVQVRFPLTQDVVTQAGLHSETIHAVSATRMTQVWEVIQLGAYMNFYLAMLNGINPAPIPTVDWFKQQLSKSQT